MRFTYLFTFFVAVAFLTGAFLWIHDPSSRAQAAPADLSGYAWSSNIGWISFNCENMGCSTSDYKVTLLGGDLSGYAWSSNVGWLSFNRGDTGNPPSDDRCGSGSGPIACVTGDVMEGWARFLSACGTSPCTSVGPGSNSGGWDGWVKFNGTWANGVTRSGNEFLGFAWGADVVGWISFNCSNNAVCGTADYRVTTSGSGDRLAVTLTADPSSGAASPSRPLVVTLTAVVTNNEPAEPIDYEFDCDNGAPLITIDNSPSTTESVTCTYTNAGNYTPRVTVEQTATAETAVDVVNISVRPPGPGEVLP